MYTFSQYETSGYSKRNEGYFKKLEKLGVNANLELPKISANDVRAFLDKEFYGITMVAPVGSCSYLCGDDLLLQELSKLFGCGVETIYGYVKTSVKKYHEFKDADIERARNGAIFSNHHAWFQFNNGQLLDLVFMNTLRTANNIMGTNENHFEFILIDDGSIVDVPSGMAIVEKLTAGSYFNYVPMFRGKMFNNSDLLVRANETNNLIVRF